MKKFLLLLFISFFTYCFGLDTTKVDVQTLAKTTKSWNNAQLPSYPTGKPEITILNIKIPPHSKLKLHKHPVINAGVLIKGKLTVVSEDNKVLNLEEGDSIVELVDTWHYGENKTGETAQIIVFYAGVEGEPITILK